MANFDINPISKPTAGSVAKYMLLPGILPQIKRLGFLVSRLLFVFVYILGVVKLIDPNHPCLRSENIGRYSFAEILLMAWGNVKFDKQHVSQTIMFFAVIAAIVVLMGMALSSVGFLTSNFTTVAHAQYFSTPSGTGVNYDPQKDWAFIYLERIFGTKDQTGMEFWVPGVEVQPANPWYTSIFIGMMKTYSKALLFLATFMILYIIITALADAARTGKPFGEKFDSLWAPIRFALAIGMLVPISGAGYNGAQMLVFQASEWGSNLASNIWQHGIDVTNGDKRALIGASASDPGYRFVRDMFLINLCVLGFNKQIDNKNGAFGDYTDSIKLKPYKSQDGNMTIYSFGNDDSEDFCGAVAFPNPSKVQQSIPSEYSQSQGGASTFFPNTLATAYSQNALPLFMPNYDENLMSTAATAMAANFLCDRDKALANLQCNGKNCTNEVQTWVYKYWKDVLGRDAASTTDDYFFAAYKDDLVKYNNWLYEGIKNDAAYGWASAGSFYLRMSYALSMLDNVVNSQPHVTKLPVNFYQVYAVPDNLVTNQEAESKCGMDSDDCNELIGPALLSQLLHKASDWFIMAPKMADGSADPDFYRKVGQSAWDNSLHMSDNEGSTSTQVGDIMGPFTGYLYDKVKVDSTSLNPLGQVIGWGNNLIYTARLFYDFAIFVAAVGLIFGISTSAISSFAFSIGNIFIVPGFMLMFIVPIMPFMYFTFAVVEWIVSIVEAVIGMPLWALSFITAEGDLLGGAKNGVKMLFEIILRPTMIVFSLLVAIIVFTASIDYFNDALQLYIGSYTSGAHSTILTASVGGLGMIFIYMFAVYTMATSCFKVILIIPNNFGRWLGLDSGFGQHAKMSGVGGTIAATSAYIVNEGLSHGTNLYMQGKNAHDERGADAEQKRKYDEWQEKENKRIEENNLRAAIINKNLEAINAEREKNGESRINQQLYQRPVADRDLSYFTNSRRSGQAPLRKQGEFFQDAFFGENLLKNQPKPKPPPAQPTPPPPPPPTGGSGSPPPPPPPPSGGGNSGSGSS